MSEMEREIREIDVLTVDDIPQNKAGWDEIFYLASSFNAFGYWGSFDKMSITCEKVKSAYKVEGHFDNCSLNDLRTELYMVERAHNHLGVPPRDEKLAYVHDLVEAIRIKVLNV
ncbi:hypothetical protein ACFPES_01655 [Paenibacillus sp. GCM10023248]|uniref:hypothetical protein n=1 Tax=unclassified Paenibacillus TaxID=185978 RepID=UPI0023799F21|nr:hypothetical protein [Paenibacillus sp. MAHUQ-63]MDD9265728.1 hypothetical protein [Paenibacillus sp. MAHUQ-63]